MHILDVAMSPGEASRGEIVIMQWATRLRAAAAASVLCVTASMASLKAVAANSTKAERVLSGSVAGDEIITAILLESCTPTPCTKALSRLIAVSRFADDPRYSNLPPVPEIIRHRFSGDIEQALKLKPDLVVLASFSRPEILNRFEQLKLPQYLITDISDINGIERTIQDLGKRMGEENAAAQVIADMKLQLKNIESVSKDKKSAPFRVLHIYADGVVSGSGTLFDAIAHAAGTRNIGAGVVQGWKKLGAETLIKLDPDALVVGGAQPEDRQHELNALKLIAGIEHLRAWREQRIIIIPDAELSAVSPHIVKAVRKLNTAAAAMQSAAPNKKSL